MPVRARVRALVIAVLGLSLAGSPPRLRVPTEGQKPQGDARRWCSSATTGRAPSTCSRPGSSERLGRINMIPDQDARMMEIATNPERLAYYLAIREAIGEGHDQLVDDMYTSNDGRLLIASRPSYADVVAISLKTGKLVWRFPVAGQRSDHMAISPNGKQARGQRLDGQPRARAAGLRRQGARHLPVGRVTARERLHRRREADHARQHRLRLHADRPGPRRPGERASGCSRSSTPKRPFKVLRRYNLRKRSTAAVSTTSAPPYAR